MIRYTIEFEEKPDGSLKIHWTAPPNAKATLRESLFAEQFGEHIRDLFVTVSNASDKVIFTEN